VPDIISKAYIPVLRVSGSPKNNTDNIMAMATLSLSTGATCDTSLIAVSYNRSVKWLLKAVKSADNKAQIHPTTNFHRLNFLFI
jgi:hypothetical protein